MKQQKKQWHETRRAQAGFMIGLLLLAYIAASIAIDTASLWAYAATILFVVFSIRFGIDTVRRR